MIANMSKEPTTHQLNIRVSAETYRLLQAYSERTRLKMPTIARHILEGHLDEIQF